MSYLVKTQSRITEFFDKTEAENYYNAVTGIGIHAKLQQKDVFGRTKTLLFA